MVFVVDPGDGLGFESQDGQMQRVGSGPHCRTLVAPSMRAHQRLHDHQYRTCLQRQLCCLIPEPLSGFYGNAGCSVQFAAQSAGVMQVLGLPDPCCRVVGLLCSAKGISNWT